MFTGYIFGVGWGFLIIYPTTVAGIIGCYWLGRLLFYKQVQNVLLKFPSIRKLDQRIEVDGIKLVILLRLGPYPFSWLNLMFSSISVSFWQYFWVVVVVSTRLALTIYIGTTLDSLLDLFHSGLNGNKAQLIGFCVSMSFLIISSTYTIYYFRKTLKEDNSADNEGEFNPGLNV
ncbi:hypothetical protein CONCODRAFT_18958 [Conidiobolus coronatus NRRL 28638]|uniref:VTT domain-containing protein n=1 Tax=Conidiobolus coronatus (strain ATCC 28846 / CBS 209.66 / NRRL 28638) TaxID=796925 RepID=A0A137P072_CONC2|nr:hypothetical protein CONCODRAFT_18958 [Conidiobolus coronatus NRRL 28638]|eukprot:KXN68473.1 hypothetical protein CONCODRAFT_18958 [Conidiobolus coronatus NRRL 28638]